MMLINSLTAHAGDVQWEEFIDELDRLNVRKAVIVGVQLLRIFVAIESNLCACSASWHHI